MGDRGNLKFGPEWLNKLSASATVTTAAAVTTAAGGGDATAGASTSKIRHGGEMMLTQAKLKHNKVLYLARGKAIFTSSSSFRPLWDKGHKSNTITNWRQAQRGESGDEWRASDLGIFRSNNNVVEREWGDRNRRTLSSGYPKESQDELPEWFDNPDAGAGTFDASGAFHGDSADDADDAAPPKGTPLLTRSHSHATVAMGNAAMGSSSMGSIAMSDIGMSQFQNNWNMPGISASNMSTLHNMQIRGADYHMLRAMEMQGQGTQPAHSRAYNALYGNVAHYMQSDLSEPEWYYEDPMKNIQGPFSSAQMYYWFSAGLFSMSMLVRRSCDPEMRPLGSYGPMPFVEREWGDRNRRTLSSGYPNESQDELPEWFDNPDAGAGTFDASGAFQGDSADDADDAAPPKGTPLLTRSHSHATVAMGNAAMGSIAMSDIGMSQFQNNWNMPLISAGNMSTLHNMQIRGADYHMLRAMEMQGQGTQPAHSRAYNALYGNVAHYMQSDLSEPEWYYEDPLQLQKNIQGPFSSAQMYYWFSAGLFSMSMLVRRSCDPEMRPLGSYGPMPFVEREWGDRNRRTLSSGYPNESQDELHEWFDNPDAGAGTFDASGAFHGDSADDADDAAPPKGTPLLTRSHSHATVAMGNAAMGSIAMSDIGMSQFQNNWNMPLISAGNMSTLHNMQIRGADYHMLRAMEMQGQGTQPAHSSAYNALYGNVAHYMQSDLSEPEWYYEDPMKNIQGPFSSAQMYYWFSAGLFSMSMLVRRSCDPEMRPLGSYGPMPFSYELPEEIDINRPLSTPATLEGSRLLVKCGQKMRSLRKAARKAATLSKKADEAAVAEEAECKRKASSAPSSDASEDRINNLASSTINLFASSYKGALIL